MAELVDRTGLGLIAGGALVYLGRDALFEGARERELAKLAGLGLGLAGVLRIVSGALSRGERIIELPSRLASELKDAVLPGPGPVPDTAFNVPILGGPLVPIRELPRATEPPPGESFGIVAGGLVSPVVAKIVAPVDGGRASRPNLSSRFEVEIEVQNFTNARQDVRIETVVTTTTNFGTKTPIRERIRWPLVEPREVRREKHYLDSGSLFEIGDPIVTVQMLVNNKPTQSVQFEVD